MSDIYRDGTYVRKNPTLHAEDAEYKCACILRLFEGAPAPRTGSLRVLDIGGGAGLVAAGVCRALAREGARVECHACDPSPEMLAAQKENNPFLTRTMADLSDASAEAYDLALLIDVIEHVPDCDATAAVVDRLARRIVYNIPTELNLFDRLRDLYMGGRYYPAQTESLGHVRFFSAAGARRFISRHHRLRRWLFPDYAAHVLRGKGPDYERQLRGRLRRTELVVARGIHACLGPLAPWLVQGSVFALAESRTMPAGPA